MPVYRWHFVIDLIGYYFENIAFSSQEIALICLKRCSFNFKNCIFVAALCTFSVIGCFESLSNLLRWWALTFWCEYLSFCTDSFGYFECFEFCNKFARRIRKRRKHCQKSLRQPRLNPQWTRWLPQLLLLTHDFWRMPVYRWHFVIDLIGYYFENIAFSSQEIALICLKRCRFNFKNCIFVAALCTFSVIGCFESLSNLLRWWALTFWCEYLSFCTDSFGYFECFEFCNKFARRIRKRRKHCQKSLRQPRLNPQWTRWLPQLLLLTHDFWRMPVYRWHFVIDLIGYYFENIAFSSQEIALICLKRCRFNFKNCIFVAALCTFSVIGCFESLSNLLRWWALTFWCEYLSFCTDSFGYFESFEFCNKFARRIRKRRKHCQKSLRQPGRNPQTVLKMPHVVFLIILQDTTLPVGDSWKSLRMLVNYNQIEAFKHTGTAILHRLMRRCDTEGRILESYLVTMSGWSIQIVAVLELSTLLSIGFSRGLLNRQFWMLWILQQFCAGDD